MPNRNNSRTALILSAFSALCFLAAGCKQSVDEVPALNGESPSTGASVASAQAESEAKSADAARAAADMKAKSDADAAVAEAKAKVAEADPYKDAVPDSVVPAGVVTANASDNASSAASELTSRLLTSGLAEHFGANHGRLVVQVNRATNHTDLTVNRAEVLRVMQDAVAGKGGEGVVSSHALQGDWQVAQPKAIHLAFDTESRALGLIPSHKLSDAPSVIVNTAVKDSGSGFELAVSAVDARSGKVFWTESKAL